MWSIITMIVATWTLFPGWMAPAVASEGCPEAFNFTKRTLVGDKVVDLCKE